MRRGIGIVAGILSALLVVATFLSLGADWENWWLKIMDFPRVQIMIALAILGAITFVTLRKKNVGTGLLYAGIVSAIGVQLIYIFPYFGFATEKVPDIERASTNAFKIHLANVFMKNEEFDRMNQQLKAEDAEVVILMETDQKWANALSSFKADYPYSESVILPNTYGMILLSKLPMKDTKIEYVHKDSVPSIHTTLTTKNGREFRLYAVHPVPPMPDEYPNGADGKKEMELIKIGTMAAEDGMPSIIAGDFNDVEWGKTTELFEQESELADVRRGRGIIPTFNAENPIMRWPLDHVYLSEEFGVSSVERLEKNGSDHFALTTTVDWVGASFEAE